MSGLGFLLGGLAAAILLFTAGDGVKRIWTVADLPVESPAPPLRTLARGVVPAWEAEKNQNAQAGQASGKSAVPTTNAPESSDTAVWDRSKSWDASQAPIGVQDKGLPRLRFELEELTPQTPAGGPPAPKTQAPAKGGTICLGEVVFDPGEVELGQKAKAQVKKMAAGILAARDAAVVLEGYTDRSRLSPKNRQKYGDNYGLSLVRAAAVARALVAAGVDPGRVYIIAYGAGRALGSKGFGRMVKVGVRPGFFKK